ncbi:hypothetical protein B0G62_104101 [Paraburkholderia eburnea]|uniref:Uncharacterized protein n=1 Tax=Paraburkholderia eburnea TaxID=1189126 RepID=A0A2S4MDK8_9BURK|nr:DUF1566 domain-containing protein [Paraburkholderia eburnea]POR52804.1 hypothetical protein B0G62_104101 [Paraburkholderia eburnea]PRZ23672.1 hypothetical protein BX588_104101 [Paraburkholderia eburnea]
MQQLQLPPLAEGEIYIGAIGDKNGDFHHVILLPGDSDDADWKAQMEWAKSIGGDLPNRIEQAMLWANFRDLFKKEIYWSNEVYHRNSGWAWYQNVSSVTSTTPARPASSAPAPSADCPFNFSSIHQECITT